MTTNMEKRNEYIEQVREKLDVMNAKIAELEAQAKSKTGDSRRELKAKLDGIKDRKQELERRVEDLRLASKPAWEDLKHGAEQAWRSLATAVENAGQRLQQ